MGQSDLNWIRSRQKLLRSFKTRVSKILGPPSTELKRYLNSYQRYKKQKWRISDRTELFRELMGADVVFAADFHAHAQSQRTHIRLLRQITEKRKVILYLECFDIEFQKWIDFYFEGKITSQELRRKTNWDKLWGFEWSHYLALIDFAKLEKIPIKAINRAKADLRERDKIAAEIIAENYLQNSNALHFVVFGESHLTPDHLPKSLTDLLGFNLNTVTCFQNDEAIYFDLAHQKKELVVEVVKLGAKTFSIQNSPPWIKWQSYLLFLNRNLEPDRDLDAESDTEDHLDFILYTIQKLAKDLDLKYDLDSLAVTNSGELNLEAMHAEGLLNDFEFRLYQYLMNQERSFVVGHLEVIYLAKPTLNHAAKAIGQWLYLQSSGGSLRLTNSSESFLYLLWLEAVGEFVCKVINHSRKTDSESDLRKKIAKGEFSKLSFETYRLFFKNNGVDRFRRLHDPRHWSRYVDTSEKAGERIGNRLFSIYRSRAKARTMVVDWLKKDFSDLDFGQLFKWLEKTVVRKDANQRTKSERL